MGLLDLLVIVVIALCIYLFWKKYISVSGTGSATIKAETMAPLGWGTYPNNYPRGRCIQESLRRRSCEIGSCPLQGTINHERYCGIVHAQDSDAETRYENISRCVNEMNEGYCD